MKYKKKPQRFCVLVESCMENVLSFIMCTLRSYGTRDNIGCVLNTFYVHVNVHVLCTVCGGFGEVCQAIYDEVAPRRGLEGFRSKRPSTPEKLKPLNLWSPKTLKKPLKFP